MNLNLQVKNEAPSETLEGLVVDANIESHPLPSFQQVLREIGPLPEEALYLGMAQDGRSMLLNLRDPVPGPILIAGDSGAGKTRFLQALSQFAVAMHAASKIQYGVITNDPQEWDAYAQSPHCIGIFPTADKRATEFIHALAAWSTFTKNNRQSVLLLLDDLDDFLSGNRGLVYELQKILICGPAKGIWPFITVNMEHAHSVRPWLEYFRTRVYGYTAHRDDEDSQTGLKDLLKGVQFSIKEKSQWIKFWIPML